ncbi:MAG: hypothetical protein M0R74_00935 [Dehalococcoidia bacterium]|nr:hypothetical protein [Dehalococcoidia bacterium]
MARISDADRGAVSQAVKHARLVDASRKLARIVKHVDPDAKTRGQRTRLEKSLTAWMKHHGGEAFDRPFSDDHKRVIAKIEKALNAGGMFAVAMPRGHGKALALNTEIPTPTGWATMGALRVGDTVFDEHGKPCQVMAKSEVWENRPVYLVNANKENAPVVADASHLWPASLDSHKGRNRIKTLYSTEDISRHRQTRARLPMSGPLDLPDAQLPVAPYVLGVWLGDGHSASARITQGDQDMHEMKANIEAEGYETRPQKCKNNLGIGSGLSRGLIDAGVMKNKHIPSRYLRASAPQRLALLQGLIDTDGYVAPADGQIEFCTTSIRLAEGALELVRSLGRKATMGVGTASANGKDCGKKYRISFYMANAARLKRKAERCRDAKVMTRHSIDAQPHGTADTVCIQVSSKSGCFLAGRAMLPTHNSTIVKWATLYCILTGRRKYVMVVAATAELAQAIIEFCRQQITESDSLYAHYPHVCEYARKTDGKAIKAKYQLRADGKTSGIQWSKTTLVLPEVVNADGKGYPSNGAILEGHGLTGNIRGKWRDTKTGAVLRPDFVLLDDPQSRESSESDSQCAMRERIVTGDILGLAGLRKRIAVVMPCTVIRRGDLAWRFLSHETHPEWRGETCKLVDKWPAAQETLWAEYTRIYRESSSAAATEFYKAHRSEMDAGACVSWEHRIRNGELSALQTAENLLIESGEQFWAEYQNDPKDKAGDIAPYVLLPDILSRKITTRKTWERPDWVTRVFASTDINPSYALSTVVLGMGEYQSAAVLWWGVHKLNIPVRDISAAAYAQALFPEIVLHGQALANSPCRPEVWALDAGGAQFDAVTPYSDRISKACGLTVIAFTGRDGKRYRPGGQSTIKSQVREQCHGCATVKGGSRFRWVAWNSCYWGEVAQRAWLGAVGAPGGITLPAGNNNELISQVCNMRLMGKGEIGGQTIWNWHSLPGKHDFHDAIAQGYALAAFCGIGTGGALQAQAAAKWRIRHVEI